MPILIKSHKGFLDHALTIATEAEACAKRRKQFEPIEPLPASSSQLAPAEAFSPHTDFKPMLLTSEELKGEKKKARVRTPVAQ